MKKISISLILSIVLISFLTFGCESQKGKSTQKQIEAVQKEASKSFAKTKEQISEGKDELFKLSEARVKELTVKIEELKIEAKKHSGDIQKEYYKVIAELEKELEFVRTQMAKAKESGSEAWDKVKDDLVKTLDNLEETYKEKVAQFKDFVDK